MQPGYKTTEFWTVIITNIISMAVVGGALTKEEGDALTHSLITITGALLSLISSMHYVGSRTSLKLNQHAIDMTTGQK